MDALRGFGPESREDWQHQSVEPKAQTPQQGESPDPAEASGRFQFAMVPDSPDTRLFVTLGGFAAADLTPAALALERALEWHDSDYDQEADFLVDFAAMAYCRAFFPSNVRKPLGHFLAVPAGVLQDRQDDPRIPQHHRGTFAERTGYDLADGDGRSTSR